MKRNKNIDILDYGVGNLGSLHNMLLKIGCDSRIVTGDQEWNANLLILPGVGAYDRAMSKIDELSLRHRILKHVGSGNSLLGVCLGMQILSNSSEEGTERGLGLIPGSVVRMRSSSDLPVPHMGWNTVEAAHPMRQESVIGDGSEFYFVHSYHFVPEDKNNVRLNVEYGSLYAAYVQRDNVHGVQFHPEKSHRFGMNFLEAIVKQCH